MADETSDHDDLELLARPVKPGESFTSIARTLYRDPRIASLLEDLNPEAEYDNSDLVEDQILRVPSRAYAQSWASKLGINLGFDPQAGGSTRARQRWRSFAGPGNAAPAKLGGNELALLAATEDFGQLVDEVDHLDTAGRGVEVWEAISKLGDEAVARGIGQNPSQQIDAIDGTKRRVAIGTAIEVHVCEVLAKCCGNVLSRTAEAIECTCRKATRMSRLLVAMSKLETSMTADLLTSMGYGKVDMVLQRLPLISAAKKALAGLISDPQTARSSIHQLAQENGIYLGDENIARLLTRAPTSGAARDRLAVHLVGLEETTRDLLRTMRPLVRVINGAAQGVVQGRDTWFVAQQVPYIQDLAQEQLCITRQDSAAGLALQKALAERPGKPHKLVRLAVRLPAIIGRALVDVDAASLERGLAPVLQAMLKASAQTPKKELKQMSAADLMARVASSAANATERTTDSNSLGATAAYMLRPTILNRETLVGSTAQQKKRVAAVFSKHYTAAESLARAPTDLQLEADVRDLLSWTGGAIEVYSDVALREKRVLDFLETASQLFAAIAKELPTPLPPAGRRRQSARGTALIITTFLLDRAHSLKSPNLLQDLKRVIKVAGGQVIETCEKHLRDFVTQGS